MKSSLKVILGYVLAIAVIFGVVLLIYRGTSTGQEPLTYGDVLDYFYNEDVATYNLDYDKGVLTIQLFEKNDKGELLDKDGNVVSLVAVDKNGKDRSGRRHTEKADLIVRFLMLMCQCALEEQKDKEQEQRASHDAEFGKNL